jgi:peptidoglycan/xylan/chitin deacetylase (PgdA/CDA1 family)
MPVSGLKTKPAADERPNSSSAVSLRTRRRSAPATPKAGITNHQGGKINTIPWPEGKRFAFTVFDDTDEATLENTRPVYDFLRDLGFRTTKSVWPIAGEQEPVLGGSTCDDDDYRQWLLQLEAEGFEIALHSATYHSSPREDTIRAFDRFKEIFGSDPASLAIHTSNAEGVYWGTERVSGIRALVYNALTRFRRRRHFRGHLEGDPLFWGDVCKARLKYVRNFVFPDINTLDACPWMPYHDPTRPYVNYWFASSEGGTLDSFNRTIGEENQNRLEEKGGACIMYTHFAKGFYRNGEIEPRFRALMERLAARQGWFVPVTELLDYIQARKGLHELTSRQRAALEWKWLRHKVLVGTT